MHLDKTLIAITVFNDRCSKLLEHLPNIDNDFDVVIVSQSNDTKSYEKYVDSARTKILCPEIDCSKSVRAIALKRQYILEYAKDYDYVIYMDDDVIPVAYTIDESTLRASGTCYKFYKTDFNNMLHRMVEVAEEHQAGMVTLTRWGYLAFKKPKHVSVNSSLNPSQFYLLDAKKLLSKNINFDTSGEVPEDFDICIRALQNGITCCNADDFMYNCSNNAVVDTSSSTIWKDIHETEMIRIKQYIKYHIPIVLSRHGNIGQRVSWKKYFDTFELPAIKDRILYELAVEGDYDKILEYLKNTKKHE